MEKKDCLAKTVLTVYRFLPRICASLDKLILQKAVGSANYCKDGSNDVYKVTNSIIEFIERKKLLINLKIKLDKIFLKMENEDARILIYRYCENLKSFEIAEVMGVCERTYFRKYKKAYANFFNIFYCNENIEKEVFAAIKQESWIMSVYREIEQKDFENTFNENVSQKSFFKTASRQMV